MFAAFVAKVSRTLGRYVVPLSYAEHAAQFASVAIQHLSRVIVPCDDYRSDRSLPSFLTKYDLVVLVPSSQVSLSLATGRLVGKPEMLPVSPDLAKAYFYPVAIGGIVFPKNNSFSPAISRYFNPNCVSLAPTPRALSLYVSCCVGP
ncbi:hypothetical protein EB796_023604 [Bugula neritina]|uniref:Uncharacterized protein n=1 Tax=Bugula neritina TaxID=10212 RepID=A0A7J7IW95_BUGNE|nr:hypothetical protein EB796_023604 [Bugula neritina]